MSPKSFRYATWLATTYLVVAGAYILVSGRFAAAIARSVAELERIEHVKGILFVVVTGAILWGVAYVLFARLEKAHEARTLERRALMLIQNKAYAAELAAAVAHDFNNLLLVVQAGLDELTEDGRHRLDPAVLEGMQRAIASARDLTTRMARAARGQRSSRQEVHCLADLVHDAVRLLRRIPRLRGREIEVSSDTRGMVRLDPVLVEQILVNLLLNASDAVGAGGRILVEVTEDTTHVCLNVHDNGTGVSDSMLEGIFEPFSTTKQDGLGLGLLSVRASAEASDGKLAIFRSPLGGAKFVVRWHKAESTARVAATED